MTDAELKCPALEACKYNAAELTALRAEVERLQAAFVDVGHVAAEGLIIAQRYRDACDFMGQESVSRETTTFIVKSTLTLAKHGNLRDAVAKAESAEPREAD